MIVTVNGADLCVETFGDPSAPAILLIGGLGSPMDWWLPEFCERLAAGPRFVIRYDLRDTGRSRTDPPGAPAYEFPDLARDAAGLIEQLAGPVTAGEDEHRDRLGEIFDRTIDSESAAKNHAVLEGAEELRPRLRRIGVPTLVLHGTEDPLFPIAHAEALVAEIPGARLVPLDGVGHEVAPRQTWDTVVDELLGHSG